MSYKRIYERFLQKQIRKVLGASFWILPCLFLDTMASSDELNRYPLAKGRIRGDGQFSSAELKRF